MAPRAAAKVEPAPDGYPRCQTCGWWDRRLRAADSQITPEQRIQLHLWAKHGQPLPDWADAPPKDEPTN